MGAHATHHLAGVVVLSFHRERKPRLDGLGGGEVLGIAKPTSWVFWNNRSFQIVPFTDRPLTLVSETKVTSKILGLGSLGSLSLADCWKQDLGKEK